jgi:hypothetical protein
VLHPAYVEMLCSRPLFVLDAVGLDAVRLAPIHTCCSVDIFYVAVYAMLL